PTPDALGDGAVNAVLSFAGFEGEGSGEECVNETGVFSFEIVTSTLAWTLCKGGALTSGSRVLDGLEAELAMQTLRTITISSLPSDTCGIPVDEGPVAIPALRRSDFTVTTLDGSRPYVDAFYGCENRLDTLRVDGLADAKVVFEYIASR